MTQRAKRHGRQTVLSRHARDLRLLQQVQARTAVPERQPAISAEAHAAGEPPAPAQPTRAVSTLNWAAGPGESLLRPRLPAAGELPGLTAPALRALVVCTARGEPTPPALRAELLRCAPDELAAAIVEGIHRWHTFQGPGEEPATA